ncbi:peptidoglycan-binding domain-containing protein [Streptomyces avidinii]
MQRVRRTTAGILTAAALTAGLITAGTATATAAPTSVAQAVPSNQCGYYSGSAYTDIGDSGSKVVEIQCLLEVFFGISVGPSSWDGQFGSDTEKAVKTFQGRKGLAKDGKVGPNTWAKLRA